VICRISWEVMEPVSMKGIIIPTVFKFLTETAANFDMVGRCDRDITMIE
jgi:hypothetical protein